MVIANDDGDLPTMSLADLQRAAIRTETDLRAAVAQLLRAHGLTILEQVRCATGVVDLATADGSTIFECKLILHRRAVLEGSAQILSYRAALNPIARAIVVGFSTPVTTTLARSMAALGVEVIGLGSWESRPYRTDTRTEGQGRRTERSHTTNLPSVLSPQLSIPNPQPSALRASSSRLDWNVANLALAQGITNPSQLSQHLGMARQGMYALWNGTTAQVSLDVLGRLARGLAADPGEWFAWSNTPYASPLRWNIHAVAALRGLTPLQLSFSTQVHMRSITPICDGTAQAVAPRTLARIGHILDTAEMPFQWGQLFTRAEG